MKRILAGLLFIFAFAIGVSAQTTAPPADPPSTPITVNPTPGCGTQFFNCYAVSLTIGANTGTAWVYPQWNGGFIIFRPNLEGSGYYDATVTSSTVNTRNSLGQITQMTITYTVNADPNGDDDQDVIMGSITFNFTWKRVLRGGYSYNITGGSGAQSITQD